MRSSPAGRPVGSTRELGWSVRAMPGDGARDGGRSCDGEQRPHTDSRTGLREVRWWGVVEERGGEQDREESATNGGRQQLGRGGLTERVPFLYFGNHSEVVPSPSAT